MCSLVGDLNQQLLPRVDSLSKQLAELYDGMIVSPPDEMNHSFAMVSEEPGVSAEDAHSDSAELHMLLETRRGGEQEKDHCLGSPSDDSFVSKEPMQGELSEDVHSRIASEKVMLVDMVVVNEIQREGVKEESHCLR